MAEVLKSIARWNINLSKAIAQAMREDLITTFLKHARIASRNGKKIILIGNGGSASIASHMAEDYSKNGNLRAIAFNDASLLTCMANDYGYEQMFVHALDVYADEGDMLVAISSSGKSKNILNACHKAREMGLYVVTLSGFDKDNPLRKLGDLNFYVNARKYGFVEISHLAILHAALDFHCGEKK